MGELEYTGFTGDGEVKGQVSFYLKPFKTTELEVFQTAWKIIVGKWFFLSLSLVKVSKVSHQLPAAQTAGTWEDQAKIASCEFVIPEGCGISQAVWFLMDWWDKQKILAMLFPQDCLSIAMSAGWVISTD